MNPSVDFLLLEPEQGGNLGSICRALKTFGFGPPLLVRAAEGIERSPEARRLAHGAREYLDQLVRYDDLETALAPYDFRIATTARRRRTVAEYLPVDELTERLGEKGKSITKVALLFGSEASGLPSNALHSCDLVTTIPLSTSYPSLNLAQALLLYAYTLSNLSRESTASDEAAEEGDTGEYRALVARIEAVMSRNSGNPALIGRIRERLTHIREEDVALIHSVLNALE